MRAAGAGGTRAAGSAGRGPRKRLPHVARGGRRCCRRALAAVVVALALAGAGCQRAPATLAPEVVARYPHDPEAFTQGLLFHDGRLFESTGLYGRSSLREVVPESGEVVRLLPVPDAYFAEGLARVDGRLIQLTWRSGVAFVYDIETFEQIGGHAYQTEGWGLCFDGEHLWMSDGSATLYRRHPDTFAVEGSVQVRDGDDPVALLNELECVGDLVYANVWRTDRIVAIETATGRVAQRIDASSLLDSEERSALGPDAVLNGIAYDPERDLFYLTGKLWPAVFEVRFRPIE